MQFYFKNQKDEDRESIIFAKDDKIVEFNFEEEEVSVIY